MRSQPHTVCHRIPRGEYYVASQRGFHRFTLHLKDVAAELIVFEQMSTASARSSQRPFGLSVRGIPAQFTLPDYHTAHRSVKTLLIAVPRQPPRSRCN